MSKIEQLIKKLCPKGVEWRPLGEVCKRHHGTAITAGKMAALNKEGAPIRVFAAGNTIADVNEGDIPEKDVIREPGIVVKARGYIGFAYCERPFSHKGELWSYTAKGLPVNLKYLYYYLLTQAKQLHILARSKSVKLPQLSTGDTDNLFVPLPPRPIQDEIVKALDAMAAAVKALEKERAARQEQFEAVREKEMIECCSANVERISLSEMGEFFSGLAGKSKDDFVEGNAKFLSYMDVFVNSAAPTDVANFVRVMPGERQNQLQVGDIVFTGSSETKDEAGMTCVIQTEFAEPVYLNSFCFGLRPNVSVQMKPEFAKYVFRSVVVRNQIIRASNGVTRFNVSKEALKKVQIPIPSVAVQKKIATQLDAFAAVVAALDEEIAARREQFAGWLERLMKFDAREVAVA